MVQSGDSLRAGINALTAIFVVGVLAGLALTPDGRAWLRNPTVMLGDKAAASAPPLPWPEAVYYAHSFGCRPVDERVVLAWSSIEGQGGARERFAAIVRHENTIGCQFHPEKSSQQGLALLGALAREVLR